MPASSNVCRHFQQGNRVACVAPGMFDPWRLVRSRDFTSPLVVSEIAPQLAHGSVRAIADNSQGRT